MEPSQQYQPMTPSSQAPNPLRPYYRPPSIGGTADSAGYANSTTSPFSGATSSPLKSPSSSFGSSARSLLSDFDLLGEQGNGFAGTGQSLRGLLDQAVWKYSSVFMAQPFEVAKMTLQVRAAGSRIGNADRRTGGLTPGRRADEAQGHYEYGANHEEEDEEEDDDDDQPSYFTSAAPQSPYRAATTPSSRARMRASPAKPVPAKPSSPPYKLDLRRPDALMEVLSQLWQREGAWGIWKGTNVTFLYSLLLRTIETWSRSLLCAVLNLPDPGMVSGSSNSGFGGLDIIDSPSPLASLSIAVAAAGVAGLVLAPLDIVRTRVMLTTTTESPRSIIPCLKLLRSWICPPTLVAPTLLHNTIPTFLSTSTPLFLRTMLRVDPIITPATYSVCTFLSSITELFVKLPIETVLRRGQIEHVSLTAKHQPRQGGKSSRPSPADPEADRSGIGAVVEIGPYTGVAHTMWRIAREEGESLDKTGATTKGAPGTHAHQAVYSSRKGQGVQGLWRGWRVGWWGLVGIWGAAAMGGVGGKGGEF